MILSVCIKRKGFAKYFSYCERILTNMAKKELLVVFIFSLLTETEASYVKKSHVVSHVDTEIGLRLQLEDKNNDLKEYLNNKLSSEFSERATHFCESLDELFWSAKYVDTYNTYEGCNVNEFNIVRYNGETKGAVADITLRFEGKYDDSTLQYIFKTFNNPLLKGVHDGKPVIEIGGLYISDYEIKSPITLVVNTHELKSPLLTGSGESKRNMQELFKFKRRKFHAKEDLINNQNFEEGHNQRRVIKVVPAEEANELLSQLKLRFKEQKHLMNRVRQQGTDHQNNREELLKALKELQKIL